LTADSAQGAGWRDAARRHGALGARVSPIGQSDPSNLPLAHLDFHRLKDVFPKRRA
jgi:hypothetical protein